MEFGNIPTDNLYKFLALSGVTIIFFFSYLNVRYRARFWEQIDALRRKQARFNVKADAMGRENEYLKSKLAAMGKATPEEIDTQNLSKREALHEKLTALETLQKTNEVDAAGIARSQSQIQLLTWLSVAAILVGVIMTSSGFVLWYYRVQVYEDQELMLKATQPPDATRGTVKQ